ncbi:hypothetical protein ACPOL_2192 [Acidisarcina polymorpha]|uniref:Uncharacterized protein n=1 Tax=Acidisarcina polymorpha TaxID=2211140 RepID=A0A2Z5FYR8_9BACT|nr:hypothetical protein [Acidisarcina polymorpha]AXC11516.1 hypothetical protein ACPOL_2192 [Acidisarcina polymorpha]
MTYIRASEIGCALDCNLQNGRNKYKGGPATDDGPRINAAMAGATAEHPITLIIDGSALISGLFLPAGGNWSIAGLGCGTGFFVKSGTNNDGIHNGPDAGIPSDPGPPAPVRSGMNVSLSNFTVNGNRGDGHHGDATGGVAQGANGVGFFGINLMNLNNIVIDKVVVVNSPEYNIRFANVGNVVVSGCVVRTFGPNSDGLHFDGPANDITITNCDFTTDDDSIALNCPEGYSGDISRVAVSNCTFNSWSLMRLYTANANYRYNIDTVTVSNCTGTLSEYAFVIGLGYTSNLQAVNGLTISDCKLTAPMLLGIEENFGSIALRNVTLTPNQSNVIWNKYQTNKTNAFLRPSPVDGPLTCTGSSLSFENCVIYRNSDEDVPAVVLENGSIIGSVEFNGFAVQDAGSHSKAKELLNLESASIGQLTITSIDSTNIEAPISADNFAGLGSVSGGGVLATGWEFPDALMANGVPYISADSGLPSIKVNGVVQPYSPG